MTVYYCDSSALVTCSVQEHGSAWMRTLLSFTVPNVEEVTRRLLASGVQTCGPADAFRDAKGHIRTVFFRDPDGILVQFDEGGEG